MELDEIEAVARAEGEAYARGMLMMLEMVADDVESPIERRLLVALCTGLHPENLRYESGSTHWVVSHYMRDPGQWVLRPQVKVGAFTVDFVLTLSDIKPDFKPFSVGIECDGHDFHEKTKVQAAHDKRRDRVLQREGLQLLRFTGSEIFRDAAACAEEIYSTIERLAWER